ncbi:MAG: argininosuccinate lyase [Gammaproteobacteria bacterium]|nr:argininosuccinate lyase [Gammaproteobacteria bacterium]MBT8111347.1 argininosuccinate lyase [Gammaproteobacteria bacterium]NND46106.1 argininosuccinate lyase [Woeseiaceae bacterium]NNL46045.1 argininosuccinate lyase [Woeseiaceae bacterium]
MSRLWEKGLPLDKRVLRYTAGEDHVLDARLVPYDVRGSIAHAEMLAATQLISDADFVAIRDGLASLLTGFEDGEWHISLEDEDAHTALESRLTANIGPAGGRLHLGRSRNDQVLTALRLYLRDAAVDLAARVENLRSSLAALAERQGDVEIPGYTHMQHAMPSTVSLWCGGFEEGCDDAVAGLQSTLKRINKNPLGSAAGYGTPGLPLDREMTTAALDFATTQSPVTAVQLSRGKAESAMLFEITLLMQDVSRMASDLLLFYTQEFAYVSLAAEVTTGSSIMPQKRNPDVLELLRASSATAQACLDESLMITAKLPSGYHRDLQRLKSPLFRSIDLAIDSVDIMAYLLEGLEFLPQNIKLDEGIFATAEAYRLVREEGIPFRDAYRQVAKRYAK